MAEKRAKESSRGPLGFVGLGTESDQTMRLALILKTDAQGSIAAVKHMFSEVMLGTEHKSELLEVE